MADTGKYVTIMYELFWNGNAPIETKDESGKSGQSHVVPKQAQQDLQALLAQAKKLRGEETP